MKKNVTMYDTSTPRLDLTGPTRTWRGRFARKNFAKKVYFFLQTVFRFEAPW